MLLKSNACIQIPTAFSDNLAKLYFLAKVQGFAKLYPLFSNRHIHSGIPKRKKEEPTSRSGEPLQA